MTKPSEKDTKQNASQNQAVESNAKADPKRGNKKEKKGNTLLLILIVLILTLIVAFGAIFMFNFAGLKTETSMWISNIPVLGKVLKPLVENKSPEMIAKEEIEQEKRVLTVKEKDLIEQEKELKKREKELESKEKQLALKEQEVEETLKKLSDKLKSVQEQVQYLEKLDNTKAMNIIMSMDSKASAVQVLRNMKKEKAAAILALMDPLQAAQILEDLAEQASYQNSEANP